MSRSRIIFAIALSLSLIAAPSFAAVKAGAKCTKASRSLSAMHEVEDQQAREII